MIAYALALAALTATLILHLLGLGGSYYWFEGYDILVHFAGGVGIGFAAAAVLRTLFPAQRHGIWRILGLVLVAGLVWELFEAAFDLLGYPLGSAPYYFDTVKDLIMDTAGGALAYAILRIVDRR